MIYKDNFNKFLIFRILWWMIVITSAIFVGLWIFEGFPIILIGVGLFSNLVYIGNNIIKQLYFISILYFLGLLRHFPLIELSSPNFLLSLLLLTANHVLAFRHFGEVIKAPLSLEKKLGK